MENIGRTVPWTKMRLQGNWGSEQRRERRVSARRHNRAAAAALGRAMEGWPRSNRANAAGCSNGPATRKRRSSLGTDAQTSHTIPASSARHHRTAQTA